MGQSSSGAGSAETITHQAVRAACRFAFRCCIRVQRSGTESLAAPGPWILAASHVGHLDPVFLSVESPRLIGWMARREFYAGPVRRSVLRALGAIRTDRQGWPRPALRQALDRLSAGEVVGVFPEGEVMSGGTSVFHGATVRSGAVFLAARAGVPVLPVVLAGTQQLDCVSPWLPARRGRLWVMAGDFIHFPAAAARSSGRREGARLLATRLHELSQRMRREMVIPPEAVP